MTDDLGDRIKAYERRYTATTVLPQVPTICRIDGKAFHTFCRNLAKPYDEALSKLMIDTTKYLVQQTNARVGYTQSDEISLCWKTEDFAEQPAFGGKVQKLCSVTASMAAAYFNRYLELHFPFKRGEIALFDCRVFDVPSDTEAANYFVWREQDATRNSISMAAFSKFSHSSLQGKGCKEMQECLFSVGVNWNDYPDFFKRGTYVRREVLDRPFTAAEIDELPPKHDARSNPDLTVRRTCVKVANCPPILRILNREGFLLRSEQPLATDVTKASDIFPAQPVKGRPSGRRT